jgi:transposase
MEGTKYIGMDVHKDSIAIAVLNPSGKLVMECVIETKALTILEFVHELRGSLHLTFEEGTWAAWLYDLLKPHVAKLVVCDPRHNGYLKQGGKSDRNDARKLAELLHSNMLRPVYHDEHGVRSLKELARSYLTITKDQARVMTRVKAIYRSWAIPCVGKQVYGLRHRQEWLDKIQEPGVRRRAEFYYAELDALRSLRLAARNELLLESKKHTVSTLLSQIPSIGPIRAALLIALPQTPDRFRSKRQLLGLQRTGGRNPRRRKESVCQWAAAAIQKEVIDSWPQFESQSRSQEYLQECLSSCRRQERAVPEVLRCSD